MTTYCVRMIHTACLTGLLHGIGMGNGKANQFLFVDFHCFSMPTIDYLGLSWESLLASDVSTKFGLGDDFYFKSSSSQLFRDFSKLNFCAFSIKILT